MRQPNIASTSLLLLFASFLLAGCVTRSRSSHNATLRSITPEEMAGVWADTWTAAQATNMLVYSLKENGEGTGIYKFHEPKYGTNHQSVAPIHWSLRPDGDYTFQVGKWEPPFWTLFYKPHEGEEIFRPTGLGLMNLKTKKVLLRATSPAFQAKVQSASRSTAAWVTSPTSASPQHPTPMP